MPGTAVAAPVLGTSVLRTFGHYSYGLYVFHLVILRAMLETQLGAAVLARVVPAGLTPVAAFAVELLLSLMLVAAVTWASWHLLEKRVLALKRSFA